MKKLNFQLSSIRMTYGLEVKTIAEILKYTNQRKAIRDHVDPERGSMSYMGEQIFAS